MTVTRDERTNSVRTPLALALMCLLASCAVADDWSSKGRARPGVDEPTPAQSTPGLVPGYQPPPELGDEALTILMKATESSNALMRNSAIEALQALPASVEPVARRALADPNRGVRFTAAMTIGELRLTDAAHLIEPLLHDDSLSVQAAAIYALHRCGYKPDPNPLARMIVSDDPEVRGNAAMIFGLLGNNSARKVVQAALGQGMAQAPPQRVKLVELQMAATLVKLGDQSQLQPLRAALYAPSDQGEVAVLACLLAGEIRDTGAVADLYNLAGRDDRYQQPPEIRMAATQALTQIDPGRVMIEVPLTYVGSAYYQQRQQAALTLGKIGNPAALPVLQGLMADPNPLVQVAAAGGVVRILAPLQQAAQPEQPYIP
jgi:HEAT repeat protein